MHFLIVGEIMTLGLFLDLFALVVGFASGVAFSMGVIRIKETSLDVIALFLPWRGGHGQRAYPAKN